MDFLKLQDGNAGSERGENVQERGACGIESDAVKNESGIWEERCGAKKECGGRNVAGNCGVDASKFLRAVDGDGIDGARQRRTECAKSKLTMIARPDCFTDDCGALGLKS